MAALEDVIREACKNGLTHFSLLPTPSEDRKTLYWRAQATPSTGHHYVAVNHTDPIEAMTACLANMPKARKRAPPKKGEQLLALDQAPGPGDEVTAAVTADDDAPPDMGDFLPRA